MKILVLLTLLGIVLQDTTAGFYSMKFFFTGSSGVPEFSELVAVMYIDEVQMIHYDSNTRRMEPRQDWVIRIRENDPNYWQSQTEIFMGDQLNFKVYIENLKQLFRQTRGVHIYQRRFGCDWDDETGAVNGFNQYGYNGEDFILLDLQTETWIAASQRAVATKQDWDNNKAEIAFLKDYLTLECPEWLKKFVNYGRSSLMRTDLPSVSFLQKTSTSPITCHATGFYPKNAVMFWRKDGEELHENVDHGEILPNPDGSFQMSVDLKPPSEPSADWGRYECVFQLSGVKEEKVYRLDKKEILTNKVIHSLKFFFTGSSGSKDFPEFVADGYVDDVQVIHYDSNIKRAEPRVDWVNKIRKDDPDLWQSETDNFKDEQQNFKDDIENLKQPGGVHIYQQMYGCDWDEETGAVTGFNKYNYDGEEFLALDLQTETWITGSPQAAITKNKWDNDKYRIAHVKKIFTHICPKLLKKFVKYGRSSLMRTDLPSVSFLQKTSTSPITCHATGFYPKNAVMFWRKDGEELHEDVDHGEILPNPDGSFQMSVDLEPPSEPSADWGRYECVFHLSGVKEDQVYRLDKKEILTNEVSHTAKIIGIVAAVVLLLGLIGVIGFILLKWKTVKSTVINLLKKLGAI